MKTNSYNLYKVPVLMLLISTWFSCKKIIELPLAPANELTSGQTFADSTNVMSAIAGIYSYAGTPQGFSFQDGSLSSLTGLSADELSTTINYDSNIPSFYNNALTATNSKIASFWSSPYTGIYQVNACLEGIQSSKGISPTLKLQLTGELKVVRALYYFNLVNLFGAVPLVTVTDYRTTATLTRAPVDTIYSQIIADLIDARQKLKPGYPSAGKFRPNLYTATAFLAKVYLYRQQWQSALDMANQVINSGSYQLESDLNSVFLDGNKEAIWQLAVNGTYYATTEASNYLPQSAGVVPNYPISTYLMNAFEPGDQRALFWIGTDSVNTGNGDLAYFYPDKYKNLIINNPTTEDFMIFRLAEVYLIRSEAQAHLNLLPGAISDLNAVRARAGLPTTVAITTNDVLDAIVHERQTELFCEWGNRWYDLKRTGKIDAVLGAEKPGWRSTAALYPIPLYDLKTNNKLIQNPGY